MQWVFKEGRGSSSCMVVTNEQMLQVHIIGQRLSWQKEQCEQRYGRHGQRSLAWQLELESHQHVISVWLEVGQLRQIRTARTQRVLYASQMSLHLSCRRWESF